MSFDRFAEEPMEAMAENVITASLLVSLDHKRGGRG